MRRGLSLPFVSAFVALTLAPGPATSQAGEPSSGSCSLSAAVCAQLARFDKDGINQRPEFDAAQAYFQASNDTSSSGSTSGGGSSSGRRARRAIL